MTVRGRSSRWSRRSASGWRARPGELTPHRVAEALREAGPPGRRRHRARGPRGAAPRRRGRRAARAAAPAGRASPTCWSTVPTRSSSTAAPGSRRSPVRFADDEAVRRLAQRLAAQAGAGSTTRRRTSTYAWPTAPGCHAVLAPVSRPGTLISLRVPRARVFTLDELVGAGTMPTAGAELLAALVASPAGVPGQRRHRLRQDDPARRAASLVDPAERLVLVEDAAELRPDHPHVVGARGAAAQRRGRRRDRRCAPWSGRRCGCGRTGWSSARSAAARSSTCSRPSTPATTAAAARCTPTRRPTCRPGWRRSPWPPGSDRAAAHSQLASGVDAVVHLRRGRDGRPATRRGRRAQPGRRRAGRDDPGGHRDARAATSARARARPGWPSCWSRASG